jgi:phage-related protein
MVANALASLTNRNKKQETYEAEVKLVPSSQDPTLDQFMSRHIDKIFLWKNGLIFTTRTEKSERTPIHLRNLEISFPMDEVISDKDTAPGN